MLVSRMRQQELSNIQYCIDIVVLVFDIYLDTSGPLH